MEMDLKEEDLEIGSIIEVQNNNANIIQQSSLFVVDNANQQINIPSGSNSNAVTNLLTKDASELLKAMLQSELAYTTRDQTLRCYSISDAAKIANIFEAQLLNAASSLPEQYIQYINQYLEPTAVLLVGQMDPSRDLKLPFKPTGLTGLMHAALSKRASGGSWGGVCSSAPVPIGPRPLFEIDLKKEKRLNDNMVKEFIRTALSGVEYIIDPVPLSRGNQLKSCGWSELEGLLDSAADNTTLSYHNASMELALTHLFEFDVKQKSHQSLLFSELKKLYGHMMGLMPAIFNELKQWEIDVIAKYSYQWAGFIAGEPQIIAGKDVQTSFFGDKAQIQFTKLLAFTFSELLDAQKLHVKIQGEEGYALNAGYTLKAQPELTKKNDGLIAQIVASSHVACEMLAPLFIEEAKKADQNFDEQGWRDNPKLQALNDNIVIS